jgi:hypothetical protein
MSATENQATAGGWKKWLFAGAGFGAGIAVAAAVIIKKLERVDSLTVWKLDRLGRSLRDLIAMPDDLKHRGVKFRSPTEAIDTDTPTGRAMWQMIGVLAELERSLIEERTKAGVVAARARGVKFGRKPKLTPQRIAQAGTLVEQGNDPRTWQPASMWGARPFTGRLSADGRMVRLLFFFSAHSHTEYCGFVSKRTNRNVRSVPFVRAAPTSLNILGLAYVPLMALGPRTVAHRYDDFLRVRLGSRVGRPKPNAYCYPDAYQCTRNNDRQSRVSHKGRDRCRFVLPAWYQN